MPTQTKVICPNCGMNRPISIFERGDENAFGTWNEDRAIIQIRDAPGGKASDDLVGTGKYRKTAGKGFPLIDSYTLDVAKDIPDYQDCIDQIAKQLVKVAKIFYTQGLLSDSDIESIRA